MRTALTRQDFLVGGLLSAAAAGGGGAVGPFVRSALAQSGRVDAQVVLFALGLERLEAEYYERALREVPDLSRAGRRLARELADNEAQHVDALARLANQLGAREAPSAGFDFGDALRSESRFLALAQTLEDTGVSAYNGAAPLIEQNDILNAAGSIAQVEARHAALVRFERGEDIAPHAFERSLTMAQVKRRVAPYVKDLKP